MIVGKNPPLIVFIRSAISEYSIEIVGKLEKEGFRKVSGRFTGRICRIRVQEGSGRFQEGRPEGHLHIFLLCSVRLCFSFIFLFVFHFYVVVCFAYLLCSLLFVVLSFCVLYVFRVVFMLVLFIDSFLFFYVFSFLCVIYFMCWMFARLSVFLFVGGWGG